jgi:CheY-like chemotaxis protein
MHQLKTFKSCEVLIEEGQPGSGFWILESGTVEVVKGDKIITVLKEKGTIFGELSDLLKEPCTSTVRAKTECSATHVEKSIDVLVTESPSIAKKVIYTIARRLSNTTNMLQNLLPETDTLSLDHELDILVVDDRQSMVQAIQSSLSYRPWKITAEKNPGVAIERIERTPYSLIILSLNLPNDGAFDFYRKLRKNAATRNLPVLASASTTPQGMTLRRRAKDAGMEHFLEKQAGAREIEASIMLALGLDPSTLYYSIKDEVLYGAIPLESTDYDKVEIVQTSAHAIENAVANRINKAILDVHHLVTPHESWKAPIEKVIKAFQGARMKSAIYGNPEVAELLNSGSEGSQIVVFNSLQEALDSLEETETEHEKHMRKESLTSVEDLQEPVSSESAEAVGT